MNTRPAEPRRSREQAQPVPAPGRSQFKLDLRNVDIPLPWLDQYRLYERIYWRGGEYLG